MAGFRIICIISLAYSGVMWTIKVMAALFTKHFMYQVVALFGLSLEVIQSYFVICNNSLYLKIKEQSNGMEQPGYNDLINEQQQPLIVEDVCHQQSLLSNPAKQVDRSTELVIPMHMYSDETQFNQLFLI